MTDRSHNEPSSKPPVDLREAGRKGGKASGEACRRRKTRRLRDVLRDKIAAEPEAVADTLLRTSAGAVVAARIAGADRPPGSPMERFRSSEDSQQPDALAGSSSRRGDRP